MYTAVLAQQQTFGGSVVRHYAEMLTSGYGVAAVAVFLVLACVALIVDASRWVWLAAAYYLGTFGLVRNAYSTQLSTPFTQIAAASQLLVAALMLLLLVAAVKPSAGGRTRPSAVLLALFALQLMLGVRYMISGFPEKAVFSLLNFCLLFVVLGVGLGGWAAGEQKFASLARAVVAGAGLTIAAALVQYVMNPDAAFVAGRLAGTTPNGGRFGYALAVAIPFTLYLATTPLSGHTAKLFYLGLLVVSLLFIVASGSRGAAVTALVAVAAFFRTRLGPVLGVGLLLVIGVVAVLAFTSGEFYQAGARLAVTENTRAEVWANLFASFRSSPLVGVDAEGALGENAYLSVAAGMGLVGLVPLVALVVAMLVTIGKCVRHRPHLGPGTRGLADLVASGMTAMLCVWMFEAYLLGLNSDVMIGFYALIAMGSAVASRLPAREPAAELPQGDISLA